ncbi:hypothetical protein ES705_27813 [subsurface metagenome]
MGGEREEIFKKLSNELADEIPNGPIKETFLALLNMIEKDAEMNKAAEKERSAGKQGPGRRRGKKKDQIKIDRT